MKFWHSFSLYEYSHVYFLASPNSCQKLSYAKSQSLIWSTMMNPICLPVFNKTLNWWTMMTMMIGLVTTTMKWVAKVHQICTFERFWCNQIHFDYRTKNLKVNCWPCLCHKLRCMIEKENQMPVPVPVAYWRMQQEHRKTNRWRALQLIPRNRNGRNWTAHALWTWTWTFAMEVDGNMWMITFQHL